MRRTLFLSVAMCLFAAAPAAAQTRDPGGFHSVLAVGQGERTTAGALAANQAFGTVPASFTNQLAMYRDLGPAAPGVTESNLARFFKPAGFGLGGVGTARTLSPRPGVTIVYDDLEIPHVNGQTRADVMFGAGYSQAYSRMFFMDVLRHTGRGSLTDLIGGGDATVRMDAAQLLVADYSEEELQRVIDLSVAQAGTEGQALLADLREYVAGINSFIADARANPNLMPAEYPALGRALEDWKPTDTVAVASLIGGIFGKGGGAESRAGQVLALARKRFGARRGRAVFDDFRGIDDPEAPVKTTRRFPLDRPGRARSAAVAVPDAGSYEPRDPAAGQLAPPGSTPSRVPAWLARLRTHGLELDGPASNATLVAARHSRSGLPLAVTGPQVAYYSPEILMEADHHGGGIDARGAVFPGIGLYILLGRGIDFSWSATTAATDNVDEFAERLCEPDGKPATRASRHYLYKGRCIPFLRREHVVTSRPTTTDPGGESKTYRLEVLRSVHGPVTGFATVKGRPVAFASARSTYFHEIDSVRAFERLNSNKVRDARSFQEAMGFVNFAFNWFYNDPADIAFLQSGWFPRRAKGTDPSLPAWGTGKWDWRGFDPERFASSRVPFRGLPKEVNPRRGYIVSWNNKQAPGWRAADDVWHFNSVHRSERLEDRVRAAIAGGGKLTLPGLVGLMGDAGTADTRGEEVLPWLRAVIGARAPDAELERVLAALAAWERAGAHRVDRNGDNAYEEGLAVAVMDEWWPRLLRGIYEPVLGKDLVGAIARINGFHDAPGPGGSAFYNGWYGYVEKDLRSLLRKRVRGAYSRRYCGSGRRARCRTTLLATLREAVDAVKGKHGSLDAVKVPATCPETTPPSCDQITFTAAGAIGTPPIPWQDRGTYQQAVEVLGRR